jgi:hypothetical protein
MAEPEPSGTGARADPSAEAQTALWLTESLILALINARIIDKDSMLEAVEVVIAAKRAAASEGRNPEREHRSVTLLSSISTSIAAAAGGRSPDVGGTTRRRSRSGRRPDSA